MVGLFLMAQCRVTVRDYRATTFKNYVTKGGKEVGLICPVPMVSRFLVTTQIELGSSRCIFPTRPLLGGIIRMPRDDDKPEAAKEDAMQRRRRAAEGGGRCRAESVARSAPLP